MIRKEKIELKKNVLMMQYGAIPGQDNYNDYKHYGENDFNQYGNNNDYRGLG